MKTIIKLLILLALPLSMRAQSLSPSVISSSGGYYTSTTASMSFTAAEMTMVQTFTGLTNILTQGFQQSENTTVGINENSESEHNVTLYPNPNNGYFNLNIYTDQAMGYEMKLFNMVGQLVLSENLQSQQGMNSIPMDITSLEQGIYLLSISSDTDSDNKNQQFLKVNLVY